MYAKWFSIVPGIQQIEWTINKFSWENDNQWLNRDSTVIREPQRLLFDQVLKKKAASRSDSFVLNLISCTS